MILFLVIPGRIVPFTAGVAITLPWKMGWVEGHLSKVKSKNKKHTKYTTFFLIFFFVFFFFLMKHLFNLSSIDMGQNAKLVLKITT